ncbi:MAG TPA: phosphatase PAP2 family protein [Pyrinomonadaceae bacterium]|nr:phosphatase PAP2 family protein [Pyrinomonadaceae bacterium]
MHRSVLTAERMFCLLALCAVIAAAATGSAAQSPQPADPRADKPAPRAAPSPTPARERRFFADILRDQRAIWTSPFRLGRGDARWLAPLGVSTLALVASDQETGELSDSSRRINVTRDISEAGGLYSTAGIAAAFYLAGRAAGNARARETGLLGGEALVDTGLVTAVLKNVTQRPRPPVDGAHAEFFDGGHSFPSGHSAGAWALATVVADEYRDRRAVQVAAYGLAAAVSVSRYAARKHFLSDVLVGGAIGYGIGRYVYRTRHDPALDAAADTSQADDPDSSVEAASCVETARESPRAKLLPFAAPSFSRARHEYGMALSWSF